MCRKISIWIIAILTLGCIAWDLIAYNNKSNATFSVIMTDWSFYTPWIPFAWGWLMGHWFTPSMGSKKEHV